jgi:hypothetical protein
MMRHDLIAFMPGSGPPAAPEGTRIAEAGSHVAILGRARLLPAMKRPAVLRAAAERARVLEELMPHGTVLPVMPGNRLLPGEVPGMVAANRPLLDSLAKRLSGRVQFQLTLRWQADRALSHFGGSSGAADLDVVRHAIAAELRTEVEESVAALGAEILALPIAGDLLCNFAMLLGQEAVPALDTAIEAIDAIWSEGFTIRLIGPYPAVSFASLHFDRVDRKAVGTARAALGLTADYSEHDLQVARRAAMMQADPDERETLRRQGEILAGLLRQGDTPGPLHLARVWSEGMAGPVPVTARAA